MARLLVIYHYFYPDDVVSARHFSQMVKSLAPSCETVTVLTSNRLCHIPDSTLPPHETIDGMEIIRIFRPGFRRNNLFMRACATALLLLSWLIAIIRLVRRRSFDWVLLGTDPPMLFLQGPIIKMLSRRTKVALWSFDVYPDALIAAGKINRGSAIYRTLRALASWAYKRLDLILSIGPCMDRRLRSAGYRGPLVECVPWSIIEPEAHAIPPPNSESDGRLRFLYSGNLGHAHALTQLLDLAAQPSRNPVEIAIAGRGHGHEALRLGNAAQPDRIKLLDFVPEAELIDRLAGADVHIVTLSKQWAGIVVPSKFFAALAIGRPVLFLGPAESAIAGWIKEYNLGWVFPGILDGALQEIEQDLSDPIRRQRQRQNCRQVYHRLFSRSHGIDVISQALSIPKPANRLIA